MKNLTALSRALIAIIPLLLFAIPMVLARSGNPPPPPGRTGSDRFSENSCNSMGCHIGNPVNSNQGKIDLDGVPETYIPGHTYNIGVTLEQQGQMRWGFQLATRTGDGNQAGTLQPGTEGFTQVMMNQGVEFISHTLPGNRMGTADGPVRFNFTWTAPASDIGEIYFSLAGNAANGNFNPLGDFIYTREKSSDPATGLPGPMPTSSATIIPLASDTQGFRTNLGMSALLNSPTNVLVHFVDQSGTINGSKSYQVFPNGLTQVNHVIRDILGSSTATEREGYLILEPDQAITAFATPVDNITQDSSVIQGSRGTSSALRLPTSTSTGLFRTEVIIINDGAAMNTVELSFRDTAGAIQETRTVMIPPFGMFRDPDIHQFFNVSDTFGPIEIRSMDQNPQNLIAISRVFAALTTDQGETGTASSFFSAVPLP